MIKITSLTKVFGKAGRPFKALDNVSLEINKKEIFCLLGPNGAGKTTLLKIISGLLQPTSGIVEINGDKVEQVKTKIGLMLGDKLIYHRLTGYANLDYFADLYDVKSKKDRINKLFVDFGLDKWKNEYVETYSAGMKSKLALARALINNPDILILDEPTLGLDPIASKEVREKIKELRNKGKLIILATHYLDEAEELADRIAVLNKSKLVGIGNLAYLRKISKKRALFDIFSLLTRREI